MSSFILATAGHVDHGKTALIKALTGTETDRLPEEKARGITIELGFAHLELAGHSIGIVDVPGHEDFVKNMVAGVGAIDLVLLVVAADDGWMPQTEEHLQILLYLGVRRMVVALTKSDLADSSAGALSGVRAQLAGTPFVEAPIVLTSIVGDRGFADLKETLAREFATLPPSRDLGKPRLAVDRAFRLRGIGTIVTGTLSGGRLHRGASVVVQPSGATARVRAIQNHNRDVEQIEPGARTALSLPELSVGRVAGGAGVWRGDVITLPEMGQPSCAIDALLTRSLRLPAKTRPLSYGLPVRVHHGSGHANARVFFWASDELAAGQEALAELRFEQPVFFFLGDRFVLRDVSEQRTLAGGVVLEIAAEERRFRSAAQRAYLTRRAAHPDEAGVFLTSQMTRDHFLRRNNLLTQSNFSREEIGEAVTTSRAVVRGEFLLEPVWWEHVCAEAGKAIDAFHQQHPDRSGLPLAQVRKSLTAAPADLVIAELCAHGFVTKAETIARATHRMSLPPKLEAAGAKIRAALVAKPFDPPSVKELAPDAIAQQALRFLREAGEVVEISAEVVLSSEALAKARTAVVDFIRTRGPASISDLRQMLGSSRRVVVPLMERLDREKVTRRVGDKRTL